MFSLDLYNLLGVVQVYLLLKDNPFPTIMVVLFFAVMKCRYPTIRYRGAALVYTLMFFVSYYTAFNVAFPNGFSSLLNFDPSTWVYFWFSVEMALLPAAYFVLLAPCDPMVWRMAKNNFFASSQVPINIILWELAAIFGLVSVVFMSSFERKLPPAVINSAAILSSTAILLLVALFAPLGARSLLYFSCRIKRSIDWGLGRPWMRAIFS